MIFLETLILAVALNLAVFLVAFYLRSDKLTDFTYGMSFVAIALYAGQGFFNNPHITLISFLIGLWALRLSVYLVIRIRKINRDKRFDNIRDNFLKFGRFWLLQGISAWVIMIPAIFALSLPDRPFSLLTYLGLAIWIIGFYFEAVGDYQKYIFINNPKNKGKWIGSGLWALTRHPNYFGEISMWIGLYIISFPLLTTFQTVIALVSPLWITILLVFLTGIPILEKGSDKKWGRQKDYKEYKKHTPILIPFTKI